MRIAVYSTQPYERVFLDQANQGMHELVYLKEALSITTASLAQGCQAVSIFTNDDAGKEVLSVLNGMHIKGIATRAAGYDNINVNAASSLNIQVAHVPEYSPYAIAEHTIAMLLAMNRKLIQANQKVKSYDFTLGDLIGFDVHGKTVGIVGLGKIGSIVARILHGFGCRILGYDMQQNPELITNCNLEYVSLESLCKQADIITLHTPLNKDTHYLIDKQRLELMKQGVMIINTGRGGLVNTADAIEALKSGKIGYLGLDVYEKEKGLFFYDHHCDILQDDLFARLLTFKNVLVTGHQAFLTETALKNIADTTLYNIDCFSKNNYSRYALTAQTTIS